jgi:hypothetical protein
MSSLMVCGLWLKGFLVQVATVKRRDSVRTEFYKTVSGKQIVFLLVCVFAVMVRVSYLLLLNCSARCVMSSLLQLGVASLTVCLCFPCVCVLNVCFVCLYILCLLLLLLFVVGLHP